MDVDSGGAGTAWEGREVDYQGKGDVLGTWERALSAEVEGMATGWEG